MKIKLTTFFIIIGFALILIYPIKHFVKQQDKTSSQRVFEYPISRDVSDYIIASGTIVPKEEVEIKPNISGIIDSIYVSIGDNVEVGDIIAEIKVIPNQIELVKSKSEINNIKIGRAHTSNNARYTRYRTTTSAKQRTCCTTCLRYCWGR